MNKNLSLQIKSLIEEYQRDSAKMEKECALPYRNVVAYCLEKNNYLPVWSDTGVFQHHAHQLIGYLDTAVRDGLDVSNYPVASIKKTFNELKADSAQKISLRERALFELKLTDVFVHIITDIKQGRLVNDSLSWKNNSEKYQSFYAFNISQLLKLKDLQAVIRPLHPVNQDYQSLRMAIRTFVDSMDTQEHTYVEYPYKTGDSSDSVKFVMSFQKRLSEEGLFEYEKEHLLDSASLSEAIKKYQKNKSLTADGKITRALVKYLNLTDQLRLKRIFVTLDRYKLIQDSFPSRYVWVNLPAFSLKVMDHDTIALSSRIICGKPSTQTPLLISDINEMVTYPTWTVPASIISKELLPGLKKNSAYLSRKGLALYDNQGNKVNPGTIDWSGYSKGIPYKVRQSSGDNNALGVMKFNFNNPHAVYLHDTNQRGLFSNSFRALSHGCVRVQEWKPLAYYIARVDSMNLKAGDTLRYTTDSINNWLEAKKRKTLPVKNKLKLYIQYFTCEAVAGRVVFHDDIYEEDKKMIEKYWVNKN